MGYINIEVLKINVGLKVVHVIVYLSKDMIKFNILYRGLKYSVPNCPIKSFSLCKIDVIKHIRDQHEIGTLNHICIIESKEIFEEIERLYFSQTSRQYPIGL